MNKKLFNATITAVMVAGTIVVVAPTAQATDIKDLPKDKETAEAIQKLVKSGISSTYSDNTFRPNATITRAQAAKIIYCVTEFSPYEGDYLPSFSDVKKSDWYYPYVMSIVDYGVMDEVSPNKFNPNGKITRGEIATILKRSFSSALYRNSDTLPFKDVPTGTDLFYNVGALYDTGVAKGISDTVFGVNIPVTRAQMAVFLDRLGVLDNYVPKVEPSSKIPLKDSVFPKGKIEHDAFVKFMSHLSYTDLYDYSANQLPEFDLRRWEYQGSTLTPVVIQIKEIDYDTRKEYFLYFTITQNQNGDRQYEFVKNNPMEDKLNELQGPKQLANHLKQKYKATDDMLKNHEYNISVTKGYDAYGHGDIRSTYIGNFEFRITFTSSGVHFMKIYNKAGTILEYARLDVERNANQLFDYELTPLQKLKASIPLGMTNYSDLKFYKDAKVKGNYFIDVTTDSKGNGTAVLYGDAKSQLVDGQTYYLEGTYFDMKTLQDETAVTKYMYNGKNSKLVKM